jgi:glutamine synthetase
MTFCTVLQLVVVRMPVASADFSHQSEIEQRMLKGASKEAAIEETVRNTLREHYPIVFNGNNYSQEWVEEARKRGLPILQCVVD